MCNDAYRRIYSKAADLLVPETRFEDIVRQVVIAKSKPDKPDRDEAWVQERRRYHREAARALERSLPVGSWFLTSNRRTSNGGSGGLRAGVTGLKQVQAGDVRAKELYRIHDLSPEEVEPGFVSGGFCAHGQPFRSHGLPRSMREALRGRGKRQAGDGREQAAGAYNKTPGLNELKNGETV
jgi:hypothetical protein